MLTTFGIEPAVLAYIIRKLTVSANPLKLRKQLFERYTSSVKKKVSESARKKA
jgi:hypothetical protein